MGKILDIDKIWAYCLTGILGFLEPLGVLILWLLIFIVVDMITGVHASWVEGQRMSSHGLQKTVWKFLMYSTAVFLLQGIDQYMIVFTNCGLANIGATLICGIELYSILENFYRITGNKVFKILTQFTLKKIKDETGIDIEENK